MLLRVQLLEQIREEQLRRLRQVRFRHVGERDLDALLQHLLELLRRQRRHRPLLAALLTQLHKQLHRLRLEVAAEVHRLRALIRHDVALRHLQIHRIAERLAGVRQDLQAILVQLLPVLHHLRRQVRYLLRELV